MTTTPYATASELSIQTGVDLTKYTAQVTPLLLAVSEAINNQCHRRDGFVADSVATARIFVGSGETYQNINECVNISSVAMKASISDTTYTALQSTEWIAYGGSSDRPDFNVLSYDEPRPYTGIMLTPGASSAYFLCGITNTGRKRNVSFPTVQVTAKWGYAVTVPDAIKQATLIHAARFFKRGQMQWGDALANADFGEVRYVKKTDPAYDYLVQHGFIKPGIG